MKRYTNSTTLAIAALAALSGCSSASNNSGALPAMNAGAAATRATLRKQPLSSPTLYVSDLEANSVTLFPANVPSPVPITTISTGMNAPEGIAVDNNGTLYVANTASLHGGNTTVTEYPAGSSAPSITINTPYRPISVTTDTKGNLYVGGASGGTVVIAEYARGRTTPIKTVFPTSVHGVPFMGGLAVDSRGNLYASFFIYDHPPTHVVKFAPGLNRERDLHLSGLDTQDFDPGLGLDAKGNLFVGGLLSGTNVYAPASRTLSRSIAAGDSQFFAVGQDGSLYDPTTFEVLEFAPGASSQDITFKGSLLAPIGAAIH